MKEEERILNIIKAKIIKYMEDDHSSKTILKSKSKLQEYKPLKAHFHFKISYIFFKKLLSKRLIIQQIIKKN